MSNTSPPTNQNVKNIYKITDEKHLFEIMSNEDNNSKLITVLFANSSIPLSNPPFADMKKMLIDIADQNKNMIFLFVDMNDFKIDTGEFSSSIIKLPAVMFIFNGEIGGITKNKLSSINEIGELISKNIFRTSEMIRTMLSGKEIDPENLPPEELQKHKVFLASQKMQELSKKLEVNEIKKIAKIKKAEEKDKRNKNGKHMDDSESESETDSEQGSESGESSVSSKSSEVDSVMSDTSSVSEKSPKKSIKKSTKKPTKKTSTKQKSHKK